MTVDVKLDGLLDDARELQPRTVALRRCWTAPAPGPRCCFAATWTRYRCARTPGWSSPRRSRAPLRSAPHSRCAPPTTSSRRRPRCPGPCSGGAARQRHRRAGRLRTGQGPARPGDGLRGLLLRAPAGARRHGLPGRLPAGPRPGAVAVQPLPPGGLRRGRAGGGRGDLRGGGAAPARRRRVAWRRANPGTDHLLRSGRRRGDLPPAGVPLLSGCGRRPAAATPLPGGGPGRRGGAAAAVPDPVLGRAEHLQPAPGPPKAAHAPRPLRDRPGRAGRLAPAHDRGRRLPRAAGAAPRHAARLPHQRLPGADQPARLSWRPPAPWEPLSRGHHFIVGWKVVAPGDVNPAERRQPADRHDDLRLLERWPATLLPTLNSFQNLSLTRRTTNLRGDNASGEVDAGSDLRAPTVESDE